MISKGGNAVAEHIIELVDISKLMILLQKFLKQLTFTLEKMSF